MNPTTAPRNYFAHPAHESVGVGSLGMGRKGRWDSRVASPTARPSACVAVADGGEAAWFDTASRVIERLQSAASDCPLICRRAWDGVDMGIDEPFDCDCLVLLGSPASWGPLRQKRLIEHCRAGRPLVALAATSATLVEWPEFALDVLGGCDRRTDCKQLSVCRAEGNWHHALLDGYEELTIETAVYRGPRLAADAAILLEAEVADRYGKTHLHPVAWLRRYRGGRVFCATLGRADDFDHGGVAQLLERAVAWAGVKMGQ